MVSVNIPTYTPARMEIIKLASDDILLTSNVDPTPGTGNQPADDPNIDNGW